MNYLQKNEVHWQQGCPALNVEGHASEQFTTPKPLTTF
jgi:hypothetical protein